MKKHGKLFLYKGNKKRTFSISHTRIIFFAKKKIKAMRKSNKNSLPVILREKKQFSV